MPFPKIRKIPTEKITSHINLYYNQILDCRIWYETNTADDLLILYWIFRNRKENKEENKTNPNKNEQQN